MTTATSEASGSSLGVGPVKFGDGPKTEREAALSGAGSREAAPEGGRRGSGLGWRSPHALTAVVCLALIAFGARSVDDLDLSSSDGLGYLLGLFGLAMMVLLLLYSVRKRVRWLRRAGSLRAWFEFHLVLGLLGPTIILYHSNFNLGSANATISLACVLAVSGSGFGGRFLYRRLHRSLAGERRSVNVIRRRARRTLEPLEHLLVANSTARRLLYDFEAAAIDEGSGLLRTLPAIWLRLRVRGIRRSVLGELAGQGEAELPPAQRGAVLSAYLADLSRAGELRLFEQLFALWHAIHVPLTIILFVSAAVHVVAVHLY